MSKQRFTSELVEGHGGVCAVIVPFDPKKVWGMELKKMKTSHGERLAMPVKGRMNGVPFEYWLGRRIRYFIIVEEFLQKRLGVSPGDDVDVEVEPQRLTASKPAKKKSARKKLR